MTLSWAELVESVKNRAGQRCEYCRMHQALQGATFHVEHIVSRSAGGPTESENLALACPSCNFHKSDRVQVADPASGEAVKLFHPRQDQWANHFSWQEYRVVGKTSIGRATVEALSMNEERHIFIRQAEEQFGLFPP